MNVFSKDPALKCRATKNKVPLGLNTTALTPSPSPAPGEGSTGSALEGLRRVRAGGGMIVRADLSARAAPEALRPDSLGFQSQDVHNLFETRLHLLGTTELAFCMTRYVSVG